MEQQSPETWTNFSQVSQHWRSSALNAPELWTDIPLSCPRWAQEMLTRSKMAKLTIWSGFSLDTSNPKIIEALKSCICAMNRVEELRLWQIPRLKMEEIFRDLPKSAPQLHTLSISVKGRSFRFFGPASIYEDFLCDTERLQCVELTRCKISWESQLLTGLTRLFLRHSSTANSSIIQFLHALQRMPALSVLFLENSIPDDDSEDPSTYPIVDLPCLQKLHISSGVGPLTTVLPHITIPHSAKFNLTCREKQSTQFDFSNFLSVLATKFLSSWTIRGLTLRLLDGMDDGLEFYLRMTVLEDRFPTPTPTYFRPDSQLRLVLTWPSSFSTDRNHAKVLTCAFKAMRFPFLTQLQMSTENCIDSRTWIETFGTLPRLTWVGVQSCKPHSFLEALVYKMEAAEKSEIAYHTVSFPKLRHIHLECTDFYGPARDSISVDMLLDCLRERCERNAEIRWLGLKYCYYISSDDVKRLKEVVVDVIWDGKEQELSDEDDEDDSDRDTIDDSDDD